jgi:transposase
VLFGTIKEPAMNEDLTRLADTVRKQREAAQAALNEAKEIDEKLQTTGDPDLKKWLQQRKEAVLKVAQDLVANTQVASSAISSTLGLINDLVRK